MKLSEIRKRCEAATPGPWKQGRFVRHQRYSRWTAEQVRDAERAERDTIRGPGIMGSSGCNVVMRATGGTEEDKEFVISARTDLPALLAWVERAKVILQEQSLIIQDLHPRPDMLGGYTEARELLAELEE